MFEWACNLCQGVVFRNHVYIGWKETKKKNNLMSLDLKKRRDSMNHRHKIDVNLTSLSFHIKTQHIQ